MGGYAGDLCERFNRVEVILHILYYVIIQCGVYLIILLSDDWDVTSCPLLTLSGVY